MIDLYTAATPNGHKASVTLEELALPYETIAVNLGAGDQKKAAFLAIDPNGRIPASVDRDEGGLAVFESGAVMIQLAEKTGRLLPTSAAPRARVLSWLMFQSIEGMPGVRRWLDAMKERPACRRGIEVPGVVPNLWKDEKGAEAFARNAAKILQR